MFVSTTRQPICTSFRCAGALKWTGQRYNLRVRMLSIGASMTSMHLLDHVQSEMQESEGIQQCQNPRDVNFFVVRRMPQVWDLC